MAASRNAASVYYIQFYVGTASVVSAPAPRRFQIAKEKLRQFESAQARGEASPLPSKTPIADVLTAYVAHIRASEDGQVRTDRHLLPSRCVRPDL